MPGLDFGADDDGGDVTSAVLRVAGDAFVEDDDQKAVGLKCGTGDQRGDVAIEPGVGLGESAVVSVVDEVGDDERKVGQGVIGEIGRKLAKWNQVELFAAVGDVGKIGERVVALEVGRSGAAGESGGGQTFGIGFESFSGGDQVTGDVILGEGAQKPSLLVMIWPAVSMK